MKFLEIEIRRVSILKWHDPTAEYLHEISLIGGGNLDRVVVGVGVKTQNAICKTAKIKILRAEKYTTRGVKTSDFFL